MDAIEKLDKVLEYLDNNNPKKEKFSVVQNSVGFDISAKDLDLIVWKLYRDGYVKIQGEGIDSGSSKRRLRYLYITYDGVMFTPKVGIEQS